MSARDLLSYRTCLVLCLKTEKKGYSVVTRQVITLLELINSNLNRRHMERVITRTLITRQLSVDVCLLQCLVSKTKVSFFSYEWVMGQIFFLVFERVFKCFDSSVIPVFVFFVHYVMDHVMWLNMFVFLLSWHPHT